MDYAIDIPDGYYPMSSWRTIEYFETYKEALKFAQEVFGADENGNINIVSFIGEEED